MTPIEYITKNLNLSNAQFEAITKLADTCGMKSLFEGFIPSADDDDEIVEIVDKSKQAGDLRKQYEKNLAEKRAKEKAEREAEFHKEWSKKDDDGVAPIDIDATVGNQNNILSNVSFNSEDSMGGYDESDSTYDLDKLTDKDDVDNDDDTAETKRPETKMQRDSRELMDAICRAAKVDEGTSKMYADSAAGATEIGNEESPFLCNKISAYFEKFTEDQLNAIAVSCMPQMMEYVQNYGLNSPMNDAVASLLGTVSMKVSNDDATKEIASAGSDSEFNELMGLMNQNSGSSGRAAEHSPKAIAKERAREIAKKMAKSKQGGDVETLDAALDKSIDFSDPSVNSVVRDQLEKLEKLEKALDKEETEV